MIIKENVLKPGIVYLSMLVLFSFGLNTLCANVLIPDGNFSGRIITRLMNPDTMISGDDCKLPVTVIDSSMLFIGELNDFDVFAINKIELCREGDPEALFVMALLASGNVTSMGQYREYEASISKFETAIVWCDDVSEKKYFQGNQLIAYISWATYLYNALSYNDAFIVSTTAVEKYSSHREFSEEIDFLRKIMKECRLSGN